MTRLLLKQNSKLLQYYLKLFVNLFQHRAIYKPFTASKLITGDLFYTLLQILIHNVQQNANVIIFVSRLIYANVYYYCA